MAANPQKRLNCGFAGLRFKAWAAGKISNHRACYAGRGHAYFFNVKTLVSGLIFVVLSLCFTAITIPDIAAGQSATVPSTVHLKKPLVIRCERDLKFGKVCPGGTDGTVVVTTGFNRYSTGGAEIRGHKFHPAFFLITGQPWCFYDINVYANAAIRRAVEIECDCNPGGKHHVDSRCDSHDRDDC